MRARRGPGWAIAVAAVIAAGCGHGPESAAVELPDFALQLQAAGEVEFGAPFALKVTAAWPRDYAVEPFDDAWLAPLTVELLGAEPRRVGNQDGWTRTYRARAFVPERAVVPRIELRAARRSDGDVRTIAGEGLEIAVRSALAGHGAEPEGAGGLVPLPTIELRTLPMVAVGAVLVLLGALLPRLRRRAAAPTPVPVAAPEPDPGERLRADLAALVQQAGNAIADEQAFCAQLAAALRRFAGASLRCDAATATTEELLATAARRWPAPAHAEATAVLGAIDLVKFAAARAPAAVRAQMLAGAERFLAAAAAVPA